MMISEFEPNYYRPLNLREPKDGSLADLEVQQIAEDRVVQQLCDVPLKARRQTRRRRSGMQISFAFW